MFIEIDGGIYSKAELSVVPHKEYDKYREVNNYDYYILIYQRGNLIKKISFGSEEKRDKYLLEIKKLLMGE